MKAFVLLVATIGFALPCYGQAFKCKTPSGATIISDSPCTAGAKTERVQASEYISPERQHQAREVNRRMASEVASIEKEKAAYKRQMQRQQSAVARADAENAQIKAAEDAQIKAAEDAAAYKKSSRRRIETSDNQGLIDSRTGTYMPNIGGGNYVDPRSGTVMHGVGGGVVNTRTGQFSPTTR